MEAFKDPEVFETKMRILNTRDQFIVQLKVGTPDLIEANNTNCVVAATARIEASNINHVNGWGQITTGLQLPVKFHVRAFL